MIERFTEICVSKTKQRNAETLLLAVLGGLFIAFGASSSSLAVHSISDFGIAKCVAGVIFPVGLMLIVAVAGELFTGDCLMVLGNFQGRYNIKETFWKLLLVFIGNFVGAFLLVVLLYGAGQYDMDNAAVGAYAIKIAYGKLQFAPITAVCSGILCNIIVCLAVIIASRVETVLGKMASVFFPILAFVVGGFEHCVANMYYIPAGILTAQNQQYAQKAKELYGFSSEMLQSISWENFVTQNLIWVTLGNLLGGVLFVALPLYVLEKKGEKKIG